MGTSLVLTFFSSLACVIGIACCTALLNWGEVETLIVCVLYSLLLIFQSLEIIQYWFQAKLLSKYTSVVILLAYMAVAAYRILLLLLGSHLYWFSISQAIDHALIAAALLIHVIARLSV